MTWSASELAWLGGNYALQTPEKLYSVYFSPASCEQNQTPCIFHLCYSPVEPLATLPREQLSPKMGPDLMFPIVSSAVNIAMTYKILHYRKYFSFK